MSFPVDCLLTRTLFPAHHYNALSALMYLHTPWRWWELILFTLWSNFLCMCVHAHRTACPQNEDNFLVKFQPSCMSYQYFPKFQVCNNLGGKKTKKKPFQCDRLTVSNFSHEGTPPDRNLCWDRWEWGVSKHWVQPSKQEKRKFLRSASARPT